MTPENRISVVVPTFNRANYLPECLDSIFAQTYPPFEVIVVDDESTDETEDVVRRYGSRVRYIYQRNAGEAGARNTGMLAATGEWVAFLDSDDAWLPRKLELQVVALTRYSGAGACFCEDGQIDPKTLTIGAPRILPPRARNELFRQLLERSLVGISTVVMRRELIEETGLFDTSLKWGVDWDFMARLALRTDFVEVAHTLVFYRLHDGSVTSNLDLRVSNGIRAVKKLYAYPDARPYRWNRFRKISEIIADAGVELYYAGKPRAARRLLARSLTVLPWNRVALTYLCKSMLPNGWIRTIRIMRRGAPQP